MKTVILAEKPDQARKYAQALGETKNNKGYIDVTSPIIPGDVVVTWGIGHLVELAPFEAYDERFKKWNLADCPFLPESPIYQVPEKTKAQFYAVKLQLETADHIIVATDPDREGENIAYSIFSACSRKVQDMPKQRLWINSMVKSEIQRGFKNLKDGKETYPFYIEAQTRQISDWLVGMNFTRIFTVLSHHNGLKGVYSIGRVQTPCNALVVENDLEIRNFKPETFYRLQGLVNKDDKVVRFTNPAKYKTKEEMQAAVQKHQLTNPFRARIESVKREQKAKRAPKLYNLGGIQGHANKKWKYSLDKTLKVIQSLYQRGYLSYPRTDCDLITTNEFDYLREHLDAYMAAAGVSFKKANMEPRKEYVNNDKVLEHYAIIPTVSIPEVGALPEEEQNIYLAVVRNTILMFAEDYIYETTIVVVDRNGMAFTAKGNVPVVPGWTQIEELEEKDEKTDKLPAFMEGEEILFIPKIEKDVTKPPVRLTEAKLGGKGGIMDKLSLGTPATRASIIKTLIDRGYVRVEKTKLFPTEKGILLYDNTKDTLLGKPEMTQQWEGFLVNIGKDKVGPEARQKKFLGNIHAFCRDAGEKLKASHARQAVTRQISGYVVEETGGAYNVKAGQTSFVIWKTIAGKNITEVYVKQLLEKGRTSLISGFKSKTGKDFKAYLVLADNKVEMEFKRTAK